MFLHFGWPTLHFLQTPKTRGTGRRLIAWLAGISDPSSICRLHRQITKCSVSVSTTTAKRLDQQRTTAGSRLYKTMEEHSGELCLTLSFISAKRVHRAVSGGPMADRILSMACAAEGNADANGGRAEESWSANLSSRGRWQRWCLHRARPWLTSRESVEGQQTR